MTTSSWSTVINHTTDAGFRAWGKEYSDNLAAVGLVKTADTGQIDWVTVARPAINTAAGYEIWRFNDSLQATAPIFIKIEYGTSTQADIPGIWITVGTSSNGAGTIGGSVVFGRDVLSNQNVLSTTTAYPSYFCHTEGFLGVISKVGQQNTPYNQNSFAIQRYSTDAGSPTGDGFWVSAGCGSRYGQYTMNQSFRTASPATAFAKQGNGSQNFWPSADANSSTTENGDFQVLPLWYETKRFQAGFGLCAVLHNELTQGSTAQIAVKGSTLRTFISVGFGLNYPCLGTANVRSAMLWE